ncbi:12941_t:CDS:2, partial [Funneliformis caledonium]
MQAFLTTPKYNKFYIYTTPTNQHQRFCNAFGYYQIRHKLQEEIESKIREYLITPIPIQGFLQISNSRPSPSQSSKSTQTDQAPQKTIEENI